MALDKYVVVLVNRAVAVDVCGKHFVFGEITGFEVVTLNENVIVLVDLAVCVNVAENIFGCFKGDRIGEQNGFVIEEYSTDVGFAA